MATFLLILAAAEPHKGWFAENATLIVGVVGILVSGLVGPSIAAQWTTRREREKDARARLIAQRDDLRGVVDEAAKALGGAVARLRPALEAQLKKQPLPQETRDFLAALGRNRGRGKDSGVPVEGPYGAVFEFRDGKISRIRLFLDQGEALRAAGLE